MRNLLNILSHLFIPRKTNNYQAKILHTNSLSFYLAFFFILALLLKQLNSSSSNILGLATDITVEKLYELTNQERLKYNLPALNYDDKLAQAALNKGQNMFEKDYWAHYAPDGTTPWEFIAANDYQYEYAGENLAKNFLFSDGVVDAWMKSVTHRENILRKEYADIGFAVINGTLNGEETTLVVQMFGKPQGNNLAAKIATNKRIVQESKTKLNNNLQPIKNSILSKQTAQPKINLLNFSFNLNIAFILVLVVALLLDFYFAVKLNLFRLNGKTFAHLIFLGFILMSLFYIAQGSIL